MPFVSHNGKYISGEAFKEACKYNYDDRYPLIPFDDKLEENDLVFIKQYDIHKLESHPPSKKVRLIVHNTDETFDDSLLERVSKFTNRVYAVNSSTRDAIQIPLGFRDDMYTPHKVLNEIYSDPQPKRDILCLLNFSIYGDENGERAKAHKAFENHEWVTLDTNNTPGLHTDHSNPETIRLRKEFYSKLRRTKFVICPFGTGKDTHRVYEALFFGCIPIIKTSFLDDMYRTLGGCWIVNDWSDVTEAKCKNSWESSKINIKATDINWWLQKTVGGTAWELVVNRSGKLIVDHTAGFFSTCSVLLDNIIQYFNKYKKLPKSIDTSSLFNKYKNNPNTNTVKTYFNTNNELDIKYTKEILYTHRKQFENYKDIDYKSILPFIKKYFNPSDKVKDILCNLKKKYKENINNNICSVYYRGNDKVGETKIASYDDIKNKALELQKTNPSIRFFIESDEKEFIDEMLKTFPNLFYFKDDIIDTDKSYTSINLVKDDKEKIFEFSKKFLAIVLFMSESKQIICSTGNVSIWIMLFRGHANNTHQYLNGKWL